MFPSFDCIKLDDLKQTFNNYKIDKTNNDIYFKGGQSSKKKSQIREKLESEKKPFNIIVSSKNFEEPYKMKDHKYLLDLPGVKPWSVRFKKLTFTNRLIIRISFYNSIKNEKSYWKQFTNLIYKENKDYIHLVYDFDYDKKIPQNIYNNIVKDIIKVYNYYENNYEEYKKITSHMTKTSKKLTLNFTLKYIAKILNEYTKHLIILDH